MSVASVLCLALLLLIPQFSWAWGSAGHRLTGQIAKGLLTSDARAKLVQIMGSDDLATIALYMDQNKQKLDERIPGSRDWHYDDKPICKTDVPYERYCPNGNCASSQIQRHYKILIDDHSSIAEKRFAIHVLVHVLGDIHQPLYVSDDDDRGGNEIRVRVKFKDGTTPTSNLHSLWDTLIISKLRKGQSEVSAAAALRNRFEAQGPGWIKGGVNTWIAEGHKLAKDFVYGRLPGFACGPSDERRTLEVLETYVEAASEIIDEQIAKAGYRIAHILNRALN